MTGKSSSTKLSSSGSSNVRKLSSGVSGIPPAKKSKLSTVGSGMSHKDVSLAEAGKYGSLSEYAFFDKVGRDECLSSIVYIDGCIMGEAGLSCQKTE